MAETFKHGGIGSTLPQPPGRGHSNHDAARDSTGILVPARFRGTAADQQDMIVLGRKQVLRRNFRFTTILGFASTVLVAWEMLPVLSVYALQDGGTAIVFWALIAGVIGMMFVYSSLAEMASMAISLGVRASTTTHPKRAELRLYLAGVCFMVGSALQGLIVLNNLDTYIYQSWHGTLLTIAVILFVSVFNTLLAVRLPMIEGVLLILHLGGIFAIIIPLWVMAPRGNVKDTILTFTTTAGWSDVSLASLIGMVSVIGILVGYDCTVHMSEEVQDASIVLPQVLMWSISVNGIMAIVMGVTFIFCIGDIDSVLASPTNEPFIQVFYNATQSYAGATIMTMIIVVMLTSACISEVATASRQLWSFARDNGLPCSKWLSHVPENWNIPLNAVLVSVVISTLLSMINIGSYVALNAINSLGVVSLLFSYTVTISCLIYRRTSKTLVRYDLLVPFEITNKHPQTGLCGPPLPPRRWSLGRYGLAINIISLAFILPLLFFAFWPVATPVTAAGLNWSPVMFVIILLVAAVYYVLYARHVYTGPVVLIDASSRYGEQEWDGVSAKLATA
ncbi:hypothetical protein Q7P36_003776 [Cladosporium allicinum]